MNRIRAVTLNLYAEHGDWDERSRVIRTGLSELRPDLIAFQEAVVRPGYDQAADVLNVSTTSTTIATAALTAPAAVSPHSGRQLATSTPV